MAVSSAAKKVETEAPSLVVVKLQSMLARWRPCSRRSSGPKIALDTLQEPPPYHTPACAWFIYAPQSGSSSV